MERSGQDLENEVLVSGVVHVATGLDLVVVAEGGETPEQLARLKTLGCDLAQGNYFSNPLVSAVAEQLLAPLHMLVPEPDRALYWNKQGEHDILCCARRAYSDQLKSFVPLVCSNRAATQLENIRT